MSWQILGRVRPQEVTQEIIGTMNLIVKTLQQGLRIEYVSGSYVGGIGREDQRIKFIIPFVSIILDQIFQELGIVSIEELDLEGEDWKLVENMVSEKLKDIKEIAATLEYQVSQRELKKLAKETNKIMLAYFQKSQ